MGLLLVAGCADDATLSPSRTGQSASAGTGGSSTLAGEDSQAAQDTLIPSGGNARADAEESSGMASAPSAPVEGGPAVSSGGSAVSSEALDPTITFPWPQTEPSTDPRCEPGVYTGMWQCLAFDTAPFEGQVSFRFERSEDGEFLELVDAKLDGNWADTYQFTSGLMGRLSCATLAFTADAVDGVWVPIGLSEGLLADGTFTGTLTGTLDPTAMKISGEWNLVADVFVDCKGPWSAELQP